jgi:ABC-2 type transport system ATP-binding protein
MLEHLGIDQKQRIRQMSKGTREKVQLILVMSRQAKLYLLDEPIGGVDPATRDYILNTIIGNYNPEASVVISTHLIADVEQVLDEVIFINQGHVVLQQSVDSIREEQGKSVDQLFREVFRC